MGFGTPAADVYRTRDGWFVKMELAGVEPDELEVTVEGDTLRVAGSRRDARLTEAVSYHQTGNHVQPLRANHPLPLPD